MNVEKDAKFRLALSSGEIYEGWANDVEVEVSAPHSSMAPYFTITITGWNLEITSVKNEKPVDLTAEKYQAANDAMVKIDRQIVSAARRWLDREILQHLE